MHCVLVLSQPIANKMHSSLLANAVDYIYISLVEVFDMIIYLNERIILIMNIVCIRKTNHNHNNINIIIGSGRSHH